MNSWQIAGVMCVRLETLKIRCDVGIRERDIVLTGLSVDSRLQIHKAINDNYPTLVALNLGGNLVVTTVKEMTSFEHEVDKNNSNLSDDDVVGWEQFRGAHEAHNRESGR